MKKLFILIFVVVYNLSLAQAADGLKLLREWQGHLKKGGVVSWDIHFLNGEILRTTHDPEQGIKFKLWDGRFIKKAELYLLPDKVLKLDPALGLLQETPWKDFPLIQSTVWMFFPYMTEDRIVESGELREYEGVHRKKTARVLTYRSFELETQMNFYLDPKDYAMLRFELVLPGQKNRVFHVEEHQLISGVRFPVRLVPAERSFANDVLRVVNLKTRLKNQNAKPPYDNTLSVLNDLTIWMIEERLKKKKLSRRMISSLYFTMATLHHTSHEQIHAHTVDEFLPKEEIVSLYQKSADHAKGSAAAHFSLASMAHQAGDWRKAEQILISALKAIPGDSERIYQQLVWLHSNESQFHMKKSLSWLEKWTQAHPESLNAWSQLAQKALQFKKYDQVLKAYEKILRNREIPESIVFEYKLRKSQALYEMQRVEEARKQLVELVEARGESIPVHAWEKALKFLYGILEKNGGLEAYVSQHAKTAQMDTGALISMNICASINNYRGNYREALTWVEQMVAKDKNRIEYLEALINLYEKIRDSDKLQVLYQELMENYGQSRMRFFRRLVNMLESIERLDLVIKHTNDELKRMLPGPEKDEWTIKLAEAYLKNKSLQKAKALIKPFVHRKKSQYYKPAVKVWYKTLQLSGELERTLDRLQKRAKEKPSTEEIDELVILKEIEGNRKSVIEALLLKWKMTKQKDTFTRLVFLYGVTGQYGDSVRLFEEYFKAHPSDMHNQFHNYLRTLIQDKKSDKALVQAKHFEKLCPIPSMGKYLLAWTYRETGNIEDARKTYLEAIAKQEDQPKAFKWNLELIYMLEKRKLFKEALEETQKLMGLELGLRQKETGYAIKIRLLKELKRTKEVKQVYVEYIKKYPHKAKIPFEYAVYLSELGEVELALDYYQKSVSPSESVIWNWQRCYEGHRLGMKHKLHDRAKVFLDQMVKYDSDDTRREMTRDRMNRYIKAVAKATRGEMYKELKAKVDANPEDVESLKKFVALMFRNMSPQLIEPYLERLVAFEPTIDLYQNWIGMLKSARNAKKLSVVLDEFFKKYPQRKRFYIGMAIYANRNAGNLSKARSFALEAILREPRNDGVWLDKLIEIGRLMKEEKEVLSDLESYQQSKSLKPDRRWLVTKKMVEAYMKIKDPDAAVKILFEFMKLCRAGDPNIRNAQKEVAAALKAAGKLQHFINQLRIKVKSQKVSEYLLLEYAQYLMILGNFAEAEEVLSSLVLQSPKRDHYREYIACLKALKKDERAKEVEKTYFAIFPGEKK